MLEPDLVKYLKTLTKLTIFVMALVAIYLLFTFVFPILGKTLAYIPTLILPFILAVIIAVLVEPVVVFFETKARMKRGLAVAISLFVVVGGFFYIVSLLITKIIYEITGMTPQIVAYSDIVAQKIVTAIADLKVFYVGMNLPSEAQSAIQDNLQNTILLFRQLLESLVNSLAKILTALPGMFVFLLIATVATFFIIKDRALLRSFFLQIIPINARGKTREVIVELFNSLVGFLKAYSILITITMITTMIGLKILGVKYVLTIGIVTGLLDILPILGPGTLFIPWILWEFISGNTGLGVSLLVLYGTISVVRQFLEPKIIGDNIGLHPLATLFSLYVGLKLGGVVGMILGPVTVVIIMACFRAGVFDSLNWRKD
ncbi:MAG: sporulation integral membrane protein YtvI [Syntrophomonadaceae bacterium]|nr:sporulation integral membrane protein YtvI [Syntrophomonadaceae bacterium]